MDKGSSFSGVYYISGEKEEGNRASIIKNKGSATIWEANAQRNGSFNLVINEDGVYSLCIQTTANVQLTVSFDFFDQKKDDELISVSNNLFLIFYRKY